MRRNFPFIILFALILGLGLFVTGCTSSTEARTQDDSQLPAEVTAMQFDNPGDVDVFGIDETVLPEVIKESIIDVEVVKPKTELEGTEPTTVNLASGNIQLVEFFAFW